MCDNYVSCHWRYAILGPSLQALEGLTLRTFRIHIGTNRTWLSTVELELMVAGATANISFVLCIWANSACYTKCMQQRPVLLPALTV